jgi:hypothetical protein
MPIIQVDRLTKEYRLGAMQGLKQTLLDTAGNALTTDFIYLTANNTVDESRP